MNRLKAMFANRSSHGPVSEIPVTQGEIHPLTYDPNLAWAQMKAKQKVQAVTSVDPSTPIPEDKVRFVCLSDTHSQIENRPDFVPAGDVILHAGDITQVGAPRALEKFNRFLGTLPHKAKIVIAGNHDLTLDTDMLQEKRGDLRGKFTRRSYQACAAGFMWNGQVLGPGESSQWMVPYYLGLNPWVNVVEKVLAEFQVKTSRELLTNCHYLQDSSVNVCGIQVYGAPWQPAMGNWAFDLRRGPWCQEKWDLIPESTDILITHGPPVGHGDLCFDDFRIGCVELLNTIQTRVRPKYHVFGHIHEGYGMTTNGQTVFVNAANTDESYRLVQPALVFDVPLPEGHSKAELDDLPVNNLAEHIMQRNSSEEGETSRQRLS